MTDYLTPGDKLTDVQLLATADDRLKRVSAALEVLEDVQDDWPYEHETAHAIRSKIYGLRNRLEDYILTHRELLAPHSKVSKNECGPVIDADDDSLFESLNADDGFVTTDFEGYVHVHTEQGSFRPGRRVILNKMFPARR